MTCPSLRCPGGPAASTSWRTTSRLFDEFVGADWRQRQDDEAARNAVPGVPDAPLWAAQERLHGYLVDFVRASIATAVPRASTRRTVKAFAGTAYALMAPSR